MSTLLSTLARAGLATGVALLAACSSGGGDDTVAGGGSSASPTNQVPASATTSSAGAFAFANTTAATSDYTAEPLVVGDDITLATSETDEPDPSI